MKILLAADESDCAMVAVKHLANNIGLYGDKPEVHLLNVQPALPGRATAAVGRSVAQEFYNEQSQKALARARRLLAGKRIRHKEVHLVGEPGTTIAAYAKDGRF
jgi:nucleotide-binding universal stress UspA family protein